MDCLNPLIIPWFCFFLAKGGSHITPCSGEPLMKSVYSEVGGEGTLITGEAAVGQIEERSSNLIQRRTYFLLYTELRNIATKLVGIVPIWNSRVWNIYVSGSVTGTVGMHNQPTLEWRGLDRQCQTCGLRHGERKKKTD